MFRGPLIEQLSFLDGANFQCVRTLQGHTASVTSVKFEPSKGALVLSGSADRTVRLWKHDSSELVFTGKV